MGFGIWKRQLFDEFKYLDYINVLYIIKNELIKYSMWVGFFL